MKPSVWYGQLRMHPAREEWTMDADRFDSLSRRLGGYQSRRTLLAAGVGLLLMACARVIPRTAREVAAREGTYGGDLGGRHGQNRRGRDQNRSHDQEQRNTDRNTSKSPPPPTCAASCPSQCAICIHGPGAPTRCTSLVSNINTFCSIGCGSDDDCQDNRPDFPYCVAEWVDRTTGQVTKASDGCAGIAPYSPAYCSQIALCG